MHNVIRGGMRSEWDTSWVGDNGKAYWMQLTFFCLILFRVSYRDGGIGTVSQQLYTALTRLQMGLTKDEMNWTVELK